MKDLKAVAIVSGGLDSTVLAYWLHGHGCQLRLVSFNYGQKHKKELDYAARTARKLGCEHYTIDLGTLAPLISRSALTSEAPVPEGHYAAENMAQTVVPNRNMMMLSIAGALAVNWDAQILAAGMHAGDHPIYPDCRPQFIRAFSTALKLANAGFIDPDFKVMTPFIQSTKADIVRVGQGYQVPFEDTWSCYQGEEIHCGRCGTCVERAEAFHEARVTDPTEYESPDYWKKVTTDA